MAVFEQGEVSLHYEIYGDGFPVLLFAPGGMRSAISFWRSAEWDCRTALSAPRSRGPASTSLPGKQKRRIRSAGSRLTGWVSRFTPAPST